MSTKHIIIKLRRGTSAEWSASEPQPNGEVLQLGEPGFETDTGKLKIGDGVTGWNNLAYLQAENDEDVILTEDDVDDVVGNLLVAGSGIGVNYNDGLDTLTISVSGLTSSFISDFDESVQDNLNTSLIAGSGISFNYNSGNDTLTISSSGTGGTVTNYADNRILTSDGTSSGINAESLITASGAVIQVGTTGLSLAGASLPSIQLYSAVDESAKIIFKDSTGADRFMIIRDDEDSENRINSDSPLGIVAGSGNQPVNITSSGLLYNGTQVSVSGHTHTSSNITNFNESVDDRVAQLLVAGTGVNLSYNDPSGTLTLNNLHTEINELSKEPQGFVNRADSVISFNDSTRTFTIAPTGVSYDIYIEGIKVRKTASESIVIGSATALNYLHFDTSTGLLSNKTTEFNFDTDVPIAYIHWNADINQSTFFGEERHGIRMDSSTHKWIHNTFGMQYISGLSISPSGLLGNGSSDLHAQVSIGNGTLYQEDIVIDIVNGNNGNTFTQELTPFAYIPTYYHSGTTGQWVRDSATAFPVKYNGTRAQYNLLSGNTWTTPNVPNDHFFAMWIVATNDINDPILAIVGQQEHSSLNSAENNNTWDSINLAYIPANEIKPLYRLIFRTNNSYTNTPKSSLQSILDLRESVSSTINGVTQNDHGLLFGLGDDDHSQYLHINTARTVEANHTFTNGLTISGGLLSAASGNFTSLTVNSTGVSLNGHTHTASQITDFNSAVNALIPVPLQGVQGLNGIQGTTGPQGTQGIIGSQGLNGIQGIQGSDASMQGIQGIQGVQGEGIQGIQGSNATMQGTQGIQGEGIQGIQGIQGIIGPAINWTGEYSGTTYYKNDGVSYNGSSYVAIQNGFSSIDPTNISHWQVIAVQGIQGIQGIQGSDAYMQGIQGVQGVQGEGIQGTQGIQGSDASMQGIQGEQGVQGIQGSDASMQGTQGIQGGYVANAIVSDTTGITGATTITNIVQISQANYDALATKDSSTLYVIT